MPTFPRVLEGIAAAWADQPDEVLRQAESLAAAVREHLGAAREPVPVGVGTVQSAASTLLRMFDRTHGGFGGAPKFPQPVYLDLLLDIRARAADEATRTIDQASHTLDPWPAAGARPSGRFHSTASMPPGPSTSRRCSTTTMLAEVYARAGAAFDAMRTATPPPEPSRLSCVRWSCDAGGLHRLAAQDAEVRARAELPLDPRKRCGGHRRRMPRSCAVYGLDRGPNCRPAPSRQAPTSSASTERRTRSPIDSGSLPPGGARLDRINAALLAAVTGGRPPTTRSCSP